jgi:5,10-methylenetetrahydromethanopterin reductase
MHVDVLLEPDQTPGQLADLARQCEQLGIQRMWLQTYVNSRDPFLSLVPAMQATSRVGLGICVISPWEIHPVRMASALMTLQEYGKGRVALVIGGGGEWPVRLALDTSRRVRAVREALELVHGAVAGKPFTYQGEMYKVYGFKLPFRADPPPLIYAGANRPQMLKATVPAADGVMYSDMPHARIRETVQLTRDALTAKNRPVEGYRISNIWAWHVKADREVALREARRELLLRGLLEPWYLESFLTPEECRAIIDNKKAFYKAYRERTGLIEGVPDALVQKCLDHFTITGTVEDIDRRLPELLAFRDAGVNELCIRLHDDPAEAIHLIGRHVLPAVG